MQNRHLKLVLLLLFIFVIGIMSVAATPAKVDLDILGTEKSNLVKLIHDNENMLICYTAENDLNKMVKQADFLTTGNWELKLFFAGDSLLISKQLKQEISYLFAKYKYDIWAISVDISYNKQKQTFKTKNIYFYDTKGRTIAGLACQGILGKDFSWQDLQKFLTDNNYKHINIDVHQAINEYLLKISKET